MQSPVDYYWTIVQGNGRGVSTPATSLGSLVHCMILEAAEVDNRYIGYNEEARPEPDKTMASTKNKAWKASLQQKVAEEGLSLVPQATMEIADAMTQVVCAHKLASSLLFLEEDGWVVYKEQKVIWQNPVSELALKSKLDILLVCPSKRIAKVIDYKTTSCNSLYDFGWSVKKYGYDTQAAFYKDAATSFLEEQYPELTFDVQVYFIPQRSTAPYPVLGVVQLDERTMATAKKAYEAALQELEGCLHTGIWEREDTEVTVLNLFKDEDVLELPDL